MRFKKNKCPVKRAGRKRISVAGLLAAVLTIHFLAVAQEDTAELSASGLLAEAADLLAVERYDSAITYLQEYLDRMEGMEDARVLTLMQEVRLKLAKVMAYLGDSRSAVDYLKQYTEQLPLYRPREAFKLLAFNLYELGEYEPSIVAATNALSRPLPRLLEEKQEEPEYEKLSKEDLGGLTARQLSRIEKKAAEEEDDLSSGFSDQKPEAEPDYTTEDLTALHMTLAEAYAALKNWEGSIEPYQFVIDHASDATRRGYAVMQMVNALIGLEKFKESGEFVSQLYRTDARYDIRVNMALMSAASALFGKAEHDSALKLYRMVLPRRELLVFQEKKMNELRRATGLPDVQITIATNEVGKIETLIGNRHVDLRTAGGEIPSVALLPPKPPALLRLEDSVSTLAALPPYEDDVLYRTGQLYAEMGRPWEAVATLDIVASRDPDSELSQRAFAEYLLVLADPLKEYELVESLGQIFLGIYKEGLGPRQVAHAVTMAFQRQEQWLKIKELLPVIQGFAASEDPIMRQFECELYYSQAVADLMLLNYKQAKAGFGAVLSDFPGSHQQQNALHWHAKCRLFLQDYEGAFSEFDVYIESYPTGSWLPEAVFSSGVCLFGMAVDDAGYTKAQARFTRVIETWPDSRVYSDACSMRADLLASKGLLDEAERDYKEAIATARTVRQATYAVTQMAAMFELENRYEEILESVNAYLDHYGEEADVAKAVYWIGKTKLAQGLVDEAVEAYLGAIVLHGGDILQDGVDLIISELVSVTRRLDEDALSGLRSNLEASMQDADNQTLQLRLQVLLAEMEGTTIELGTRLITELEELEQAPPPVLGVICDASFAAEDYSRAEEILQIFQMRYEESEYLGAALKLRGFDLFSKGLYDEAVRIVEEAQARYGTNPDAAWAQIMRGRIQLALGRIDEARETFRATLTVRAWRGEPYAEAAFRLGKVEEAAGEPRKAFGWYQRVYVQYKGHAGGFWAAEAYLASARCLLALGLENDMRNTYRALLFDKYVNQLPQAAQARQVLGEAESLEINRLLADGIETNMAVQIEREVMAE